MNDEAIFRVSLCCLAAVACATAIYTQSFKKTVATYVFGMFAICGVLLPDWEYFDRQINQWVVPLTVDHKLTTQSLRSNPNRFRLYPVRVVVYATVYGFAFYKWWNFVFSN